MPSLEDRPEHTPSSDLPELEDTETVFAAALRSAADEPFVRQAVAEKLQETEGNEQVETFVRRWKHALVQQLERTVAGAMTYFLAHLDTF